MVSEAKTKIQSTVTETNFPTEIMPDRSAQKPDSGILNIRSAEPHNENDNF
jgi:hypothetical protein